MSVSHYQIMNYWKDKCITEDGCVEIDIGYPGAKDDIDTKHSVGVVEDWGEPRCFACGSMNHEYTEYYDDNGEIDIPKTWNQSKVKSALQQAHIIPKSLGGQFVPENLFLLCPYCHEESPDTIYPEEFFKWVYWRRHQPTQRWLVGFKNATLDLASNGIPPLIDASEVAKEIGPHAWKVSMTSYESAFRGNAKKHYNAVVNSVPDSLKPVLKGVLKDHAKNVVKSWGWDT